MELGVGSDVNFVSFNNKNKKNLPTRAFYNSAACFFFNSSLELSIEAIYNISLPS